MPLQRTRTRPIRHSCPETSPATYKCRHYRFRLRLLGNPRQLASEAPAQNGPTYTPSRRAVLLPPYLAQSNTRRSAAWGRAHPRRVDSRKGRPCTAELTPQNRRSNTMLSNFRISYSSVPGPSCTLLPPAPGIGCRGVAAKAGRVSLSSADATMAQRDAEWLRCRRRSEQPANQHGRDGSSYDVQWPMFHEHSTQRFRRLWTKPLPAKRPGLRPICVPATGDRQASHVHEPVGDQCAFKLTMNTLVDLWARPEFTHRFTRQTIDRAPRSGAWDRGAVERHPH